MIVRRPKAMEAVAKEALWIAADNQPAAERFVQAVEATLKTLERMPRAGRVYLRRDERLQGMRMQLVRRFPNHLLFFRPIQDGIEFVWLAHGARDIAHAMRIVGLF